MKTALQTLAIAVASAASAPLAPPGHTMEGHKDHRGEGDQMGARARLDSAGRGGGGALRRPK